MATNEILWELSAHTLGKHLVLRSYLDAWLPILGRYNDRIVIIDGFSGPGEYKGGEEGSPVIALRALEEHRKLGNCRGEVVFKFIESHKERAGHLRKLLETNFSGLSGEVSLEVVDGEFQENMTSLLDTLDEAQKRLAPSFVMVDPFGVQGLPMSVMARILSHEKCEVYISFMYESLNRHKKTSEFETHLNELFGCEDWKESNDIEDKEERKSFLYELYEKQLRNSGAKQVIRFELYNENRLKYAIFFATGHIKGSDVMKQAIWKNVSDGEFKYIGKNSGELDFSGSEPDCEPLAKQLATKFGSGEYVSIEALTDFVKSDETDFHSGHLKTKTLKPMEIAGRIEIDESTRKRKKSYPDGCLIRFK